jgi:predicted PurR-regulated permease PerM
LLPRGEKPRASEERERRTRVGGWPIAAALALIIFVLYVVRYALLPFVFAAGISFILDPWIGRVQHRFGSARWPVAAGFCLLLYLVTLLPAYWIAPIVAGDVAQLLIRGPSLLRDLLGQLVGPKGIGAFGVTLTPDDIIHGFAQALSGVGGARTLMPLVGEGVATLLGLVLTLMLLPYFMISGPQLAEGAIRLLPPERRGILRELMPKILPVLRRYLIGILLVVLYTMIAGWIGFGPVFGLPHAVFLAIVVGLLEIIPLVGPISSATIVGLIAIQRGDIWAAATLGAFAVGLRVSIDNLVGPLLLGRAAKIHPVVVMFAFVCGGMLFGVVGILLAVPIATSIKIALAHYYAEPVRDRS